MDHQSLIDRVINKQNCRSPSGFSTTGSEHSFVSDEDKIRLKFFVNARTEFGWEIKVVGNTRELGNWDVNKSICLRTREGKYPIWTSRTVVIKSPPAPLIIEYKYVRFYCKKNEVRWENFGGNREIICKGKPCRYSLHEVHDFFDIYSKTEILELDKIYFIQDLSKIPLLAKLEYQLTELIKIMSKDCMNYSLLAMVCIVVENMKNSKELDFREYSSFILWCNENITFQQTKVILNSTRPTCMCFAFPKQELKEKIEIYQAASASKDDFYNMIALSDLRRLIFNELNSSKDKLGLLISDVYLEKKSIRIIGKIIDTIKTKEFWKIAIIGTWICQLLYLASIKPKQISIIQAQLQLLNQQENVEILKDLLNELFCLVLDFYTNLYEEINHQECKTLASILNSDYNIIFDSYFDLCSKYLIKSLTLLNQELSSTSFICYNSGNCKGTLKTLENYKKYYYKKIILVAEQMPEDLELNSNIVGVISIKIRNLFNSTLINARKIGIPVAIGFFLPFTEGNFVLNVTEDIYTIKRVFNY